MQETDVFQEDVSPISLSRVVDTIRRYAGLIVLALAAVACAYAIVAAAVLLAASSQTVTSLPFRLEFKGADQGEYPNGLKFSVSDITATPILLDVWQAQRLSRFVPFDRFNRSLYIFESNRDLERLTAEYQARLADPRLTAVDRERIQSEFEGKRASIDKSGYVLQFMATDELRKIPQPVVAAMMNDVLRTWARRAAVEKKALSYNTPVLTPAILADIERESTNPLVRLLLLRRRMEDVLSNIDSLAENLPGAELVRAGSNQMSLAEVRLVVEEMMRFRIEPLIATVRGSSLAGDRPITIAILRAQLAHDERALAAAQAREQALRQTLVLYDSNASIGTARLDAPASPQTGERQDREAVMPQLSEGFLDRIVSLADRNANREYRQDLTEEIKKSALAAVPLRSSVEYDRLIIEALESGAAVSDPAAAARFATEWRDLVSGVRNAITTMNSIYTTASRLLYPETELYSTLGPPATTISRTISPLRIILGGILTLLIALPLILVFVFVHNRLRAETAHPATETA